LNSFGVLLFTGMLVKILYFSFISQDVVKLIKLQFAAKQGYVQDTNRSLTTPTFPVPSHDEPRFLCFVDPEAEGVCIHLSDLLYFHFSFGFDFLNETVIIKWSFAFVSLSSKKLPIHVFILIGMMVVMLMLNEHMFFKHH